jgi:hypothetical protein
MKIVACGDSWAWGAELVDQSKAPYWIKGTDNHNLHFTPHHEEYRLKNKYIQLFADKVNASEVIDLSYCSSSNDAIERTLIEWLVENEYTSGRDTSDLFVSIGWSSPERLEFYYKKQWGKDNWYSFGPWSMAQDHKDKDLDQFMRLYFDNFCNTGEYMHRWILQLWQTELMLKKYNIKYVMHQAFYDHHQQVIHKWNDKIYLKKGNDTITKSDKLIWNSIDPIRFMHKDDPETGTSHNYMLTNSGGESVFAEMHPNTLGHKIWADHMYDYCVKNNLL